MTQDQERKTQRGHQTICTKSYSKDSGLHSRPDWSGLATVAKWTASDVLPERRLMDPRSTNRAKYAAFLG
jgi:hypothetical protein